MCERPRGNCLEEGHIIAFTDVAVDFCNDRDICKQCFMQMLTHQVRCLAAAIREELEEQRTEVTEKHGVITGIRYATPGEIEREKENAKRARSKGQIH